MSKGKKGNTKRAGMVVLLSLLTIWVCAIILPVSEDESVLTLGNTSPYILVIDAGHGGDDGGAVSLRGRKESEINLEIALALDDLAGFLGIPHWLTRSTEELDYPPEAQTVAARKRWDTRSRAERIREEPNAFLISIHQNDYPTQGPCGSQVLYNAAEAAHSFAMILQETLKEGLDPENRRVCAPADQEIYLLSHVDRPAVLVECGFLSNPRESELLDSHSYKLKIASVIAGTFYGYTGEKSCL